MIYLDNNATTRVHPEVLETMLPFLAEDYGNPSAGYGFGKKTRRAVEKARGQVAELIGADESEIVFTSCGTESINTALHSALRSYAERRHVVTTAVEHSATEKCCQDLEKSGHEISRAPVNEFGEPELEKFRDALKPGETALASVIWANNETGVISPVHEAAEIAAEAGVLFHTDAVQAVGKVAVNLSASPIHLLSLSGHKLHAPKGIGALYISRRVRFHPWLIGGGQENDRRSGTENVAGIVGLGKAAELMKKEAPAPELRDRFEAALRSEIRGVEVNGHPEKRLPNTSNLFFEGVNADAAFVLLDQAGICCSLGSACSTGSRHPSAVLRAMGFSDERIKSSLRFSFSQFNSASEIDDAVRLIAKVVERVRTAMPQTGSPVVSHL